MSEAREQGSIDAFLLAAHQEAVTGALAGGVAHYFNNLLGGVLGLVTLAPGLGADDLAGLCARLQAQVEEASQLTRALLSLTRRGKAGTGGEMTDVAARTRELSRLAHACGGSAASVVAQLPEAALWAAIPPVAFSECLLPLMVSAAQAAGELRPGDGRVDVRLHAEQGACVIHIEDNGPPTPVDDDRDLRQLIDAGEGPTSRSIALVAAANHLARFGGRLTRTEQGCTLRLLSAAPV